MANLAEQQTITSLFNAKKIPEIIDSFFANKPFFRILWGRRRLDFTSRTIETEIITSTVGGTDDGYIREDGVIAPTFSDPISNSVYFPKLFVKQMAITEVEKSVNKTAGNLKIANSIDVKFRILMRQIQDTMATNFWNGTAVSQGANDLGFNNVTNIFDNSLALGDVGRAGTGAATIFVRWQAVDLDASDSSVFGDNGNPLNQNDLIDETKDVFIPTMLDKLFAQIAYKNHMGSANGNPDLVIMPTFLYKLLTRIPEVKKLGTVMGDLMTSFGTQWVTYDGVTIIPDDSSVLIQTTDFQGAIHAFSLGIPNKNMQINVGGQDILVDDGEGAGLFFSLSSDLALRMFPPRQPSDQLIEVMMNATYGNIVTQDRNSMGRITGLLSPTDYVVNADS